MGTIAINLNDTPDKMPTLTVGEHTFTVKDFKTEENKDGGTVYVADLEVIGESDADLGKRSWERFDFQYMPARVKFKQFCNSCGVKGGADGVDTSDLIGQTCRGLVAARSYKDKSTGEQVETTQIKTFLF